MPKAVLMPKPAAVPHWSKSAAICRTRSLPPKRSVTDPAKPLTPCPSSRNVPYAGHNLESSYNSLIPDEDLPPAAFRRSWASAGECLVEQFWFGK